MEKKKLPWWAWVLIVFFGLVVLGQMGKDRATAPPATPTTSPSPGAPAAPPVSAPPPAQVKKAWREVITVKGTGNKRTGLFALTGGETRLTYRVKGNMVMCGIYVLEAGTSLERNGGLPEVMVTESAYDHTMLVKPAGSYYLDVNAANCNWSLIIEELR